MSTEEHGIMSHRTLHRQSAKAYKTGDWTHYDYHRADHQRKQSSMRRERFVKSLLKPLTCQECGGSGEYVADSIDFGDDEVGPIMQNIYETCPWCDGTGLMTPHERGRWLSCKREEKREAAA